MAKINEGSFRDWNDGETVKARDYKQEREIMRTAINNTYDRFLEEEAELQQLELDLREQGDYALAQGDYAKGQGNAVQEALEKSVNLIKSPTKPEGIVPGRLWLDPSDNAYQGTVFNELSTLLAQTEQQLSRTPDISQSLNRTNTVRYLAHRGFSALAPENTIPAFELAGKHNYWGIETDVINTSDGHWVVIHDDTVDRTTNGSGTVNQMTLSQIRTLTVDEGSNISMYPNLKVPTLVEFLNVCKKYNKIPVIEIKPSANLNFISSFVDIIKSYGFETTAMIMSVKKEVLNEIRLINKKILLIYSDYLTGASITYLKQLGNAGFCIPYESINYSGADVYVQNTYRQGIDHIIAWTVNSNALARTMRNYGVNYILTDTLIGGNNL